MTFPDHTFPDDRSLWRQVAVRPAQGPHDGSAPCPADLELAAFIDGRLDGAERDRMERHLAECAACLAAVREVPVIVAGPFTAAPSALLDRARALIAAPLRLTERRVTRSVMRPGAPSRHAPFWARAGRWSLIAASVLATCFLGYRAGAGSVDDPVLDDAGAVTAMSFGALNGDEADLDLDLLDSALGEVSS